jgi:hypothetical protein
MEDFLVRLLPQAHQALARLREETGDTATDCINQAIQTYEFLVSEKLRGGTICIRDAQGKYWKVRWDEDEDET